MKLNIFGSCGGAEPIENRHHTSFALEINDQLYWFDAGENCSFTAHTMSLDLLKISNIFISHPHMDHVGGLGNLLWTIRKLTTMQKINPKYGDITVYMPNMETWDGVMSILRNTEGNYACEYQTIGERVRDGVVYEDENISVHALHNHHLPQISDGWQSFSYAIYAEGKKIIFSGDVKGYEDLKPLLEGGCDLLLMETGHHDPAKICELARADGIGSVYFLHHGRKILNGYDTALAECKEIFDAVRFCNDRDIFEI